MRKVDAAGVGSDTCLDHLLLNFNAKKSSEPVHEVRIIANESCSPVKQHMLIDEIL